MRRFLLNRFVDVTGLSGVGIVADGVVFPDGQCVVRWRGARASTVVWDSISHVEVIHGHGGNTRIQWVDAVCTDCGLTDQLPEAHTVDCPKSDIPKHHGLWCPSWGGDPCTCGGES